MTESEQAKAISANMERTRVDLGLAPPKTASHPSPAELKGCPFCGGEAGALMSELNGEWRVWCLRPGAVCGIISAYRDTEAEAIAVWNRRTGTA